MQITSRFTIAVHIIVCLDYLQDQGPVTSRVLAGSVGVNPVIIRTVVGKLKEAGIVSISQGKIGIALGRPLDQITFYDIYRAVDCVDETGLFHFHENPNPACPVGRNIHRAADRHLAAVQRAMEDEMKSITLADVAADARKAMGAAETGCR